MKKTDYFDGIQVLRFIAATLVVWCHAADLTKSITGPTFLGSVPLDNLGAIGVDVFFVISGFIIAQTGLMNHSLTAGSFMFKRLWRIVPLYFLMTLPWIYFHRGGTPLMWVTSFLFWPVAGDTVSAPLLPAGWTLCFEMLFYAACACVLSASSKKIGAIVALAAYGTCLFLASTTSILVFSFLGSPLILEFLAGIAVAYALPLITRRAAVVCGVLSLCWTGGLAYLGPGNAPFGQYNVPVVWERLALFGPPAVLSVVAALGFGTGRFTSRFGSVASYLGAASYAIYISHQATFRLGWKVLSYISVSRDLMIVIAIALATIVGVLVYECVEKPVHRLRIRTSVRVNA